MTDQVTKEKRITSLSDMAVMSADIMSDTYNDEKLSPEVKMRIFSQGVRNVSIVNRMEMDRHKMARLAGLKDSAVPQSLTFQPESE